MQIPIIIERVLGNGYRSRGGEPYSLSAEGETPQEVVAKLEEQIRIRQQSGVEFVSLKVNEQAHPLAEFAGMFKDDPLIDEWVEDVAEYRRSVDADLDRP